MNTYTISGLTLHTHYECPTTQFDWVCTDDNYDGTPDAGHQLMGMGKTEIEAIHDYLEQYVEHRL